MKNRWYFAAAATFPLLATSGVLALDSLNPDQFHLVGSQCTFANENRQTVLVSDWVSKFWIKVDGKIVEFTRHRPEIDGAGKLANKRWRETLDAHGLTIAIDLAETARGDDSIAYKGRIELKRGGLKRRVSVTGGCGA